MHAMLLCAGHGTRFRPVTNTIAKPAIPFLGVPLCGFPLFYLEQIGLSKLVVNTHHLPDTVREAFEKSKSGGYDIHFSHEASEVLGSGGGIYKVREQFEECDYFFVINGDEVFIPPSADFLNEALKFHKDAGALATLVTCEDPRAGHTLGAVQVKADQIIDLGIRYSDEDFASLTDQQKAQLKHNAGVYIYSKRIFDFMPSHKANFHIFKDCLLPAIARGEKVMSYHISDLIWWDMSSEEDYMDTSTKALQLLEQETSQAKIFKKILAKGKF